MREHNAGTGVIARMDSVPQPGADPGLVGFFSFFLFLFFFFFSFQLDVSLDLSGKRESQLRKCFHHNDL